MAEAAHAGAAQEVRKRAAPLKTTQPSEGLLFYFPFDEQASTTTSSSSSSRGVPGLAARNSTGKGRPVRRVQAPLKCTADSLARPCVEFGGQHPRDLGIAGSAGVSTFTSATKRRYRMARWRRRCC